MTSQDEYSNIWNEKYSEKWENELTPNEELKKYWKFILLNKRNYGGIYQSPINEDNSQEMSRLEEFINNLGLKQYNNHTNDRPYKPYNNSDRRNNDNIRNNDSRKGNADRISNDECYKKKPILENLSTTSTKDDNFNRFTNRTLIKPYNK